MKRIPFALAALPLALAVVACRNDDVVAYRIAKDSAASPPSPAVHADDRAGTSPAATSAPGAGMADTRIVTASGPSLTWTAPAEWRATTGSAVRKATFAITDDKGGAADLAVTAFPGDVGGEIANINRWRGQISLAPWSEAEAAQAVTRLEHHGLKIAVVDLHDATGRTPMRMLGALVPHAGATWFFKLLGPDALVAREKDRFLAFLATLQPAPANG